MIKELAPSEIITLPIINPIIVLGATTMKRLFMLFKKLANIAYYQKNIVKSDLSRKKIPIHDEITLRILLMYHHDLDELLLMKRIC